MDGTNIFLGEKFEIITKINKAISNLIDQLHQLELSGQKNSKDYASLVYNLIMSLDVEKDSYERLELTFEDYIFIIEKLLKISDVKKFLIRFMFSIDAGDIENNTDLSRRMFVLVYFKLLNSPLQFLRFISEECTKRGIKPSTLYKSLECQRICKHTILSIFLEILETYIADEKIQSIRSDLIKQKYQTCLIMPNVCRNYMKEYDDDSMEEEIDETVSKTVDDDMFTSKIDLLMDNHCDSRIRRLLRTKDFDYEKTPFSKIFDEIYLRTVFCCLDDETLEKLNSLFRETIGDPNSSSNYSDKEIAISIITKAFETAKEDKIKFNKNIKNGRPII